MPGPNHSLSVELETLIWATIPNKLNFCHEDKEATKRKLHRIADELDPIVDQSPDSFQKFIELIKKKVGA